MNKRERDDIAIEALTSIAIEAAIHEFALQMCWRISVTAHGPLRRGAYIAMTGGERE